MVRAEEDENGDVSVPDVGRAEPAEEKEHGAATRFLYVPDLSEETGWTAFRVKATPKTPTRPIGFRRRER